jgi:ferric-dicitrate binding protein FerR (iron transport regulator)
MFVFSNERQAGFGTTAKLALNDHSHVTLNAKSTVSYPTLFQYIRTLKLDGEAYFEVAKGSTFTVETPQGNVRVLGTKFNVLARPGFFEAVCYEGKVQVSHNDFCIILKPGEAVRFYGKKQETWKINEPKPLWTSGESGFRNTPLQYVITELENQYHKEIQYPKQMAAVRFTGSFTHKNLEIALQSVCLPLHLRYTETQPGKIVLSE